MNVTTRLLLLVILFMVVAVYYFREILPIRMASGGGASIRSSFLNAKNAQSISNSRKAQLQLMQNDKDCFICE